LLILPAVSVSTAREMEPSSGRIPSHDMSSTCPVVVGEPEVARGGARCEHDGTHDLLGDLP
jgi:hypothetical protein